MPGNLWFVRYRFTILTYVRGVGDGRGFYILPPERQHTRYLSGLRRFEQHILPQSFIKIRHAGYLHSKNKMERIAAVCSQLKLPAPMQRVHTPVALRMLLQTGKDMALCPVCKKRSHGID